MWCIIAFSAWGHDGSTVTRDYFSIDRNFVGFNRMFYIS